MPKTLSLLAGLSILALAGAANAGGITLTANQMDKVTAGAAHNDSSSSNNVAFTGQAQIGIDSRVKGNSASLGFDNEAIGKNSNVQGTLSQITAAGRGSSQSGLFDSHVKGNSASLGFDNEAIGKNSNVQGTFSQISVAGQGSSQSGLFVSAANGSGMRGSR